MVPGRPGNGVQSPLLSQVMPSDYAQRSPIIAKLSPQMEQRMPQIRNGNTSPQSWHVHPTEMGAVRYPASMGKGSQPLGKGSPGMSSIAPQMGKGSPQMTSSIPQMGKDTQMGKDNFLSAQKGAAKGKGKKG